MHVCTPTLMRRVQTEGHSFGLQALQQSPDGYPLLAVRALLKGLQPEKVALSLHPVHQGWGLTPMTRCSLEVCKSWSALDTRCACRMFLGGRRCELDFHNLLRCPCRACQLCIR